MQKSLITVENAWEQKMFTTMEKRPMILKTPLAIFINEDACKRSPFYVLISFSQEFFRT